MKYTSKEMATLDVAVRDLKAMANFWDGQKNQTIATEMRELSDKVKAVADKIRPSLNKNTGAMAALKLK